MIKKKWGSGVCSRLFACKRARCFAGNRFSCRILTPVIVKEIDMPLRTGMISTLKEIPGVLLFIPWFCMYQGICKLHLSFPVSLIAKYDP